MFTVKSSLTFSVADQEHCAVGELVGQDPDPQISNNAVPGPDPVLLSHFFNDESLLKKGSG